MRGRSWFIAVPLLLAGITAAPSGHARAPEEFVASETDFGCITEWRKIHNLRVFNHKRARLRKALRIIKRGKPGHSLPVGTIVQLVPFEAMAKRGGDFNP